MRQHIQLIRSDQARLTRRNTIANRTTYYDEKHVHHCSSKQPHTGHSSNRKHSHTSSSKPEYVVHEYEEERRKPNHVDTVKAQRDYYYAHALPSPYRGMIEDTPREEKKFDGERGHSHGHGHTTTRTTRESYCARSNSTYERGRTRSRSSAGHGSDADSEAEEDHDRRRGVRHGGERGGEQRSERRRRSEWVDAV